jgi:hypothetical protein
MSYNAGAQSRRDSGVDLQLHVGCISSKTSIMDLSLNVRIKLSG